MDSTYVEQGAVYGKISLMEERRFDAVLHHTSVPAIALKACSHGRENQSTTLLEGFAPGILEMM